MALHTEIADAIRTVQFEPGHEPTADQYADAVMAVLKVRLNERPSTPPHWSTFERIIFHDGYDAALDLLLRT